MAFKTKTVQVIFHVPGGKELKYEFGNTETFLKIIEVAQSALQSPDVQLWPFDSFTSKDEMIETLIAANKGYNTYLKAIVSIPADADPATNDEILKASLKERSKIFGYVDVLEKTYSMQLLSIYPGQVDDYVIPIELQADADYYKNLREEQENNTENTTIDEK